MLILTNCYETYLFLKYIFLVLFSNFFAVKYLIASLQYALKDNGACTTPCALYNFSEVCPLRIKELRGFKLGGHIWVDYPIVICCYDDVKTFLFS